MKRLFLACAFLAASAAHAQWAREPDAVLGVKLGQPLAAQMLPACPARAYESPVPCIDTHPYPLPGFPPVHSLGGHPFNYVAMTMKVDAAGTVNEIQAGMAQQRFAEFKAVLVERYGPPSGA